MFFLLPIIFNAVVSIALSYAATLVAQIFKQDQKQPKQGVRGTIQTGGDNPLAFIMGRYGTAGQLEYAGTWGNDGDTPNAFFTKVISVSDLPVRGLNGLYVNGERVTLLPIPENQSPWLPILFPGYVGPGNPVQQYRIDGKDHLWVRFYDGNQTAADPFLISRFGSAADRPWLADMIGRGVAYVVITALVNRELFSGLPDYLMEIDGISLADRRGGTAQHDNPIVGIDNVLGGFYYDGQWVYGPQSIGTNRRPLATWRPEMDKCDVIYEGQKTFRFGYEVVVDEEPHVVIGEMLKAAQGRIAEIGGIYKPLVGGPNAPVVSFTDEDIVISEGQTFDPFPGLEATYNGITATYPEPSEAWENKEAPPRYRSDLEVLDDNRRLPFSTNYHAVPYAVQVQRLMRAAIEETRRFRRHVQTMPPEWWEFEPLDAAVWTSERNGYANKVFLITAQDDLPNGNQVPALQEQDPTDYSWSSDYVLPWDTVPLVIARPEPQEVKGFYVEPAVANDDQGRPRRPAIDAFWDVQSVTVDVRAVRLTVFLADALIPEWEGEAPDPIRASARLTQAILHDTLYDVQIEYVPFSGRATVASSRMRVRTPNLKFGPLDVQFDELAAEITEKVIELDEWARFNTRETIEEKRKAILLNAAGAVGDFTDRQILRREASSQSQANKAEWKEDILVATGPNSALALRIEELRTEVFDPVTGLPATNSIVNLLSAEVSLQGGRVTAVNNSILQLDSKVGQVSASGLWRVETVATSAGATATAALLLVASEGAISGNAAIYANARSDGSSDVFVVANRFAVKSGPSGTSYGIFAVDNGVVWVDEGRIRNLTSVQINVANLLAQNVAISGQLSVGAGLLIDGPNGRIVVSD